MVKTTIESCLRFFSRYLSGYGSCKRCACGQFDDAGNDYCKCGHGKDDHNY